MQEFMADVKRQYDLDGKCPCCGHEKDAWTAQDFYDEGFADAMKTIKNKFYAFDKAEQAVLKLALNHEMINHEMRYWVTDSKAERLNGKMLDELEEAMEWRNKE